MGCPAPLPSSPQAGIPIFQSSFLSVFFFWHVWQLPGTAPKNNFLYFFIVQISNEMLQASSQSHSPSQNQTEIHKEPQYQNPRPIDFIVGGITFGIHFNVFHCCV